MPAFTTADASERLAKRQAAKQLGVSAGIGSGVKVKTKRPNLLQSAVRGLGTVYDYAKNQPGTQSTNPINTGAGVSMGTITNPIQSTVEPTRLALRRAVGDITAIPGVGQPSASPTAADIRSGNWAAPAMDYAGLAVDLLPSVRPAYQEIKRAMNSAIAKSMPSLPIQQAIKTPASIAPTEYQKLVQRQRNMGFSARRNPTMFNPLEEYFSYKYPEYQDFLRQKGEQFQLMGPEQIDSAKDKIREIDALFEKAPPLVDPIYTYRGVRSTPELDEIVDNMKPGDVYSDPAFMSTSIDKDVANEFLYEQPGYIWEIEMPQGTQTISPHSLNKNRSIYISPRDEREFLLPRNSQLEILNRENNRISARLLPPNQRRAINSGLDLDTPTPQMFELANRQRRVAEASRTYDIDLDEAAIMVEVEDEFRASLISDAAKISAPETRAQFIEWVQKTPIEFIRRENPEFDKRFVFMAEMLGFGE